MPKFAFDYSSEGWEQTALTCLENGGVLFGLTEGALHRIQTCARERNLAIDIVERGSTYEAVPEEADWYSPTARDE